jgi:hypothetical protein
MRDNLILFDYLIKLLHLYMDLNQLIRSYAKQPLTHQLLMSLLKDYKRPNDKIHHLLNANILQPVKKGLYIAGQGLGAARPEPFLLANHILGPSYVSADTALSYYGLIPERVFEVSSMTTKASRSFSTSAGQFSYTKLPLPYYSFGIVQEKVSDEQFAMMASPEKALFDKIVTTKGLVLRSLRSVSDYLLEDLRMEEENLKALDTNAMLSWQPESPKADSLLLVIKTLQKL